MTLVQMADEDRLLWALDLVQEAGYSAHIVGGNAFEVAEDGLQFLEPAIAVGAVLSIQGV